MLDETLQRERQFHDQWANAIDIDGIQVRDYFEACTAPENRFILKQLGNLQGKSLLDIGCGAGETSVYFALKGAKCTATDYSPKMVEIALKLAEINSVEIQGCTANAMELPFEDNTFDIVYAANLLHHIPDPLITVQEMHRVLKPGGKACFWDPLKHNPIINIYREIAKDVRTEDEAPLDINFVKSINKIFSHTDYDTFWIATLWIFLQFYLVERVNPNQERYWKKIIIEKDRLQKLYDPLEKVDRLLKKIPFFSKMAWNIAIVATK